MAKLQRSLSDENMMFLGNDFDEYVISTFGIFLIPPRLWTIRPIKTVIPPMRLVRVKMM